MNSLTLCAILAQSLLTFYFIITHWVSLYPWNDLQHVSFKYEKPLNTFMQCIQILVIFGFAYQINWIMVFGLIFWSLWLYGHIVAWWIPYFFGVSDKEMQEYNQTFGKTYKFLKTKSNYPAPDACHTFIGILTAFVIPSTYAAFFYDGHIITLYSTLIGIFAGSLLFVFFAYIMTLTEAKK